MRQLTSLPLDDDIIDRILVFLPNYSTLLATILACKHFYDIFKNHPNSIVRAVSYNVTGPALPQAIRVLRYTPPDPDASAKDNENTTTSSWKEDDPISPITNEECRQLQRNAEVVNTLEDIFSTRHKDRASRTNVLTSIESWRFRRAMYRMMLFAKAFPLDDEEEIEFEDALDPDELQKARLRRKEFLAEFTNNELCELHSVSLFLKEVAAWACVASGTYSDETLQSGDVALARGPALILEAYVAHDVEGLSGYLTDGIITQTVEDYISDPLSKIWEERKQKSPPTDASHWTSILDDIKGDKDICHSCHVVHGLNLWNETNWEYLDGVPSFFNMQALVKGNLIRNIVDGPTLKGKIATLRCQNLLKEIHAIPQKNPPFREWDKQDWMCETCIAEIIRSHFHIWFLERQVESK
ncbi:hypothetical protein H0H81_008914 [Sphagnurus paluster]|uniref:F-box domain-containing protein n=1 Tax=Sphagnurus paluster TaxID=117069 RepID=A0A9P7K4J1_9AGAR|nr:hypothetical protein H0H81_008914 [Sphagnurus paluster]